MLAVTPEFLPARFSLALALLKQGDTTEALAETREAVRLAPGEPAAHFNLGNTYALLGRYPEAIREYEIVLQLNPVHAAAQAHLAEARRLAAGGQ